MKKILIITYYWPPSGGAGVQRWLKFAKYLPEYGIQPIILTVDPDYASYAQIDKSLLDDVTDSAAVFKTKTFEFYNLYKKITGKRDIPSGGFASDKKESIFNRLAKAIRGNFFIPDPRKGWNRYAYRKAVELIRLHNISTVVTTSPPHSTQLIGLKLKKNTRVQWIADLRDPWTDIYYYNEIYRSALAKRIDKKLELKVLNNADQIITVSEDLKRIFLEKTKSDTLSKYVVIQNGYDEDDFKKQVKAENNKFIITYTGTISESYHINGFLDALNELGQKFCNKITLRFVGLIPPSIVDLINNKVPDIELELVGYVSHMESINYLLESSMQLLVIPNVKDNKGIVTGKFFEYLASQKPILAIGPEGGDLDKIIQETRCGKLLDYNDINGIRNWLKQIYRGEWEKPQPARYSRRNLTRSLVKLLNT